MDLLAEIVKNTHRMALLQKGVGCMGPNEPCAADNEDVFPCHGCRPCGLFDMPILFDMPMMR